MLRRSRPSNSTSPLNAAFAPRVRPSTVRFETLLPEPDSPTMPSERPGVDGERDPVDGAHDAVVRLEPDLQVADVEQRHG